MKLTSACSYRYALRPSPAQAHALGRASDQARRLWNELVTLRNWAEDEQRHGRREALLHGYGRLLARKALAGVAYTQARRLMRERGLPDEAAALTLARAEQVQATRRYGHRRLALTYAIERARRNAKAKGLTIAPKAVEAVARRFASAGALAIASKRGQPCPKRLGSTVTVQGQTDPRCVSPVDFALGTVDLATLMGSECCRAVPAVLHRPLPPGARIKQVAVTATATGFFLILTVEAPAAAFLRPVPALPVQTVAGIDPGRGTALTASDTDGRVQFELKPPLFQDARFLKKTRRLQRRAARQVRAANPACLDERGRWKKSSHASVVTHGLRKVRRPSPAVGGTSPTRAARSTTWGPTVSCENLPSWAWATGAGYNRAPSPIRPSGRRTARIMTTPSAALPGCLRTRRCGAPPPAWSWTYPRPTRRGPAPTAAR